MASENLRIIHVPNFVSHLETPCGVSACCPILSPGETGGDWDLRSHGPHLFIKEAGLSQWSPAQPGHQSHQHQQLHLRSLSGEIISVQLQKGKSPPLSSEFSKSLLVIKSPRNAIKWTKMDFQKRNKENIAFGLFYDVVYNLLVK